MVLKEPWGKKPLIKKRSHYRYKRCMYPGIGLFLNYPIRHSRYLRIYNKESKLFGQNHRK